VAVAEDSKDYGRKRKANGRFTDVGDQIGKSF